MTYYHIELARHAIIFAENAAVETYLDTGNKAGFENGSEALSLHPDFGDILRAAADPVRCCSIRAMLWMKSANESECGVDIRACA